MAIKTQTELVTQSDNTFLDNTTGQIIPTNHRLWNEDVLETMFEGIAGRVVTKSEFDTLVANSELVVGCVYTISAYQLTNNFSIAINVIARSANEVDILGYSKIYDSLAMLQSDIEANVVKIVKHFGTGLNVQYLSDGLQSFVNVGAYALGGEFNFNTALDPTNPFGGYVGRMSYDTSNQPLNHNLYAQKNASQNWLKGFMPITSSFGNNSFYPDNGIESTWGTYGIGSSGSFGQLVINPSDSNMSNITDVRGNFHKVNNTIFGQVHFQCDFDVQQGYNFDFGLPFLVNNGSVGNLIVNGQATNGQHNFLIRGNSIIGSNQDARCTIYIIGNHIGIESIYVDLTFSYTLDY